MAKPRGMIRLSGAQGDITFVESKTYGEHTRKSRESGPVNDVLKENNANNTSVNAVASSITHPFAPYRKNFYDGKLWSRLQSVIRKKFNKKKGFDWNSLVNFEFFALNQLKGVLDIDVTCSISGHVKRKLSIEALTLCSGLLKNKRATRYQQSLITLFLDDKSKPIISAATKMFRRVVGWQNHNLELIIPPKTVVVITVIKCELFKDNESIDTDEMKGMKVIFAADLRTIGEKETRRNCPHIELRKLIEQDEKDRLAEEEV